MLLAVSESPERARDGDTIVVVQVRTYVIDGAGTSGGNFMFFFCFFFFSYMKKQTASE